MRAGPERRVAPSRPPRPRSRPRTRPRPGPRPQAGGGGCGASTGGQCSEKAEGAAGRPPPPVPGPPSEGATGQRAPRGHPGDPEAALRGVRTPAGTEAQRGCLGDALLRAVIGQSWGGGARETLSRELNPSRPAGRRRR